MKTFLALLVSAWPMISAAANTQIFESPETPVALVELYTSEGCSSCPPAEAWLGRLKNDPALWKQFVPVAFHVDYWNGLGWADRFSSPSFTERQRAYSAAWRSDSVYTPGLVLNGQEWRSWIGRDSIPVRSSAPVGKLRIEMQGEGGQIVFFPVEKEIKPLQVEVAYLAGDLESNVARGENGGRKLHHTFTVLQHFTVPLQDDRGRLTASFPLPATRGIPITAVTAWVTTGPAQPPIQATGGWLSQH